MILLWERNYIMATLVDLPLPIVSFAFSKVPKLKTYLDSDLMISLQESSLWSVVLHLVAVVGQRIPHIGGAIRWWRFAFNEVVGRTI